MLIFIDAQDPYYYLLLCSVPLFFTGLIEADLAGQVQKPAYDAGLRLGRGPARRR